MLCEKAIYKGEGQFEKPVCASARKASEDMLFGDKCPLIYYCRVNERFEQTEDMLTCPYREEHYDMELILRDRLDKIRTTIDKYGEENFYISFSGGKDSTIMSHMIDLACPGNRIPRVYSNTGIEYNEIVKFVRQMADQDERIVICEPTVNIKAMLEKEGYPFKSKVHSAYVNRYQRSGKTTSVKQYLGEREDKEPWSGLKSCPKMLRFQFTPENTLHISDKCCQRMKKDILHKYVKESGRKIAIIGIRAAEGGNRINAECLAFRDAKLKSFQPLAPLSDDFMEWYRKAYDVQLCKLYYPPYNFKRTGCKGCPFAQDLQHELDVLEEFFPEERRQCEIIWKPVYEEYRRLNYRLKAGDT